MPVRRLYLDTNILIAAYEQAGGQNGPAQRLLAAADRGLFQPVTSLLTLAEVLVAPFRRGDEDLAALYRDLLQDGPGLRVVPIDRDVLCKAADLRARLPALKLPDAIHLATAVAASCTGFVSSDQRMPMVDGLKAVLLSDEERPDLFEDLA